MLVTVNIDKWNALRLGKRLVAEVTAAGPGRRAFVSIQPGRTPADREATREGWTRPDRNRTFTLEHWDYDADLIDGWDYDVGAVCRRRETVAGEAGLTGLIKTWSLRPEDFRYPWQTGDPR